MIKLSELDAMKIYCQAFEPDGKVYDFSLAGEYKRRVGLQEVLKHDRRAVEWLRNPDKITRAIFKIIDKVKPGFARRKEKQMQDKALVFEVRGIPAVEELMKILADQQAVLQQLEDEGIKVQEIGEANLYLAQKGWPELRVGLPLLGTTLEDARTILTGERAQLALQSAEDLMNGEHGFNKADSEQILRKNLQRRGMKEAYKDNVVPLRDPFEKER